MNDMIKELPAFSAGYRSECAAAAAAGGTAVLVYERGHGTSLMAMQAGMRSGARTMLFVVRKALHQQWMEQLARNGYAVVCADSHKGSMGDICRQAASYKGDAPIAFIAAPNQIGEAGHWYEAWRDRTAFGFVAAMDAADFGNMKSEKTRGLKTMMDRAKAAILLVDRDNAAECAAPLARTWNVGIRTVLPGMARAASNACEAAGMDA